MKSIIVTNLNKSYGNLKVLKDISFEVNSSEIFGLIGADGSGKSTLFDILVSLKSADSGEVVAMGMNVKNEYKSLRKVIGYMPGRFSLYQDLSIIENLNFFASIYKTSLSEGYDLIKEIYDQIEPFKNRSAGKLSGGMKQKLALCCALIHHPKILFLDEPTTGVDPVSRREFWQILNRLKCKGITIVVSTPYMDEAVQCDRVALIQNGEIMKIETPQMIINSFSKTLYGIKNKERHTIFKLLSRYQNTYSCYTFGQSIHQTFINQNEEPQNLELYLKLNNTHNSSITEINPTIEDCFIELSKQNRL